MNKKNFHHGDLRNSLIELAMQELEKVGPEQLSLRELAKLLGVSRSAPYRHFENKDALLQSIAGIGLEQLGNAYVKASNSDGNHTDRLRSACKAYIDFADTKPELYSLIFSGGLEWQAMLENEDEDGLFGKSKNSFAFFEQLVANAIACDDPEKVRNVTLIVWGLIYGCTKLKMNGMLRAFTDIEEFESVLLNAASTANMFDV